MAAEKLIRMTKRLFSDLERMRDNLQKSLNTSAPAGPFPEPADPTMRSIFAIVPELRPVPQVPLYNHSEVPNDYHS